MTCLTNWENEMITRKNAADRNDCRDLLEVTGGNEWLIRRLQVQFPQFLWKFTEGITLPGYIISIAKQLEKEFNETDKIPTDLYPCEYFHIMKHSTPTDMALQPKRFEKVKVKMHEKLQLYYAAKQSELVIPDEQLLPNIPCGALIDGIWHRAKLESFHGQWIYVYLVDEGHSRQVTKNDVRRLSLRFGHYPPMVVRARVRGAHIQRMSMDKVDKFEDLLNSFNYMTRCQIVTSSEPHQINVLHPIYGDYGNVCSFLLEPLRGPSGDKDVWLPRTIADNLMREHGMKDNDESVDSDYSDDEEDDEENEVEQHYQYVRSLPSLPHNHRIINDEYEICWIENEHFIVLTRSQDRQKRNKIEELLTSQKNLQPLPAAWLAFGTVCAVRQGETVKRAAIVGIEEFFLELLLVDYGMNVKVDASEVFSLPNEDVFTFPPIVTIISLALFPRIHYSRTQILRCLAPSGTFVRFEKEIKSKNIPIKGSLYHKNGVSIDEDVLIITNERHLNLNCLDVVQYHNYHSELPRTGSNLNFVYFSKNLIIYKKSKLVLCPF